MIENNQKEKNMIPKERQDAILETLNNKGYISVEELSKKLYVSLATIRRDLNELEKNGFLKRTHGGASFISQDHMITSIDYRTNWNSEEKIKIAKKAALLVDNGMNIFIDSSSTTLWLAQELANKKDLNVLTNNISIAQILSKDETNHVEVVCGTYNYKHGSIFGNDAANYIAKRHADILFVSASGFNSNGVSTKTKRDIATKQAFQKCSDLTVLLMDHTKFNEINYYLVYSYEDIDIVIVDQELPENLLTLCKKHKINVIVVN